MVRRRDCLRLLAAGLPGPFLRGAASFPTTVADRVDRRYKTTGARPNGLQATRDGIWILDAETGVASLVHYLTGEADKEIPTPAVYGSGITFDGLSIWVSSANNRKLIRVDVETGEVQTEYEVPGAGPVKWRAAPDEPAEIGGCGIEWRSGELFVSVPPAAAVQVIKAQDGSLLRSLPAPGIRPHGLGWDPDGSLWCTDCNSRSFFKMDPASGKILKQHMLPFASPEVGGKVVVPHGMSIWQRMIYFCSPDTGELYRTPLINRMS